MRRLSCVSPAHRRCIGDAESAAGSIAPAPPSVARVVVLGFVAAIVCGIARGASADSADAAVARGKYLAQAGDCMSCHTAAGGAAYAGGRDIETPFGPLASPNITPDKATGIGNWSDDDFYKLMHEGIGRSGEYVYPVMPFPWYTIVTREDALAIKAYLFSLPPVSSPRKPNGLSFPYNVRTSLAAWRSAFFKPGEFKPDPAQSAQVNRGAYLVNGLAHCGECHNARPVAGTSRWREPLAGGTVQGWYAPNITSDVRSGIGAWSNADLVSFLKTGTAPGKGVAVGPMAEAVHSLSHLTDDDLGAIAAYLKTTPPKADKPENAPTATALQASGAQSYLSYCASCHGVNGEGMTGVPPLKGDGAVLTQGPQNVISVVLGGLEAKGDYAPMPAIGIDLSDDDIANVANYVRNSWGNAAPATATPGMVAGLRKSADSVLTAAPVAGCPSLPKAFASTLGGDAYGKRLHALTAANMYQSAKSLVTTLRARHAGAKNADLINALIVAYCPIVRADTALDARAKALRMGQFANYVYLATATKQK